MALSDWWLFNTALGNSEGLLAAAVLWAAVAQLAGRHRAALILVLGAALLRPEAWPFLGGYALWLWRTGRERLPLLAAALLPVPLLWFGPDVVGAGGALGASDAARGTASPQSAVNADLPALEVLVDFAELVTVPALLAAAAGVALGGMVERRLAAAALAWVAIVAVMTQAGYAGNPRYNVAAAAIGCVLAGAGAARMSSRSPMRGLRRHSSQLAVALALVAAVLVFTAGDLSDQLGELGDRADRRTDLQPLVTTVCAPPRTNQPMKAMLAWYLDVRMEHLAEPPEARATVYQAPPGYAGEPPEPQPPPGAETVAGNGEWTVYERC
jgi:hypothetical protein